MKTTGIVGLIQKSERNEMVLEVVEERREEKRREREGGRRRNRWGAAKETGTLSIHPNHDELVLWLGEHPHLVRVRRVSLFITLKYISQSNPFYNNH